MEQDFVAMTPSFTKDGEKLLYSATEAMDESMSFNYSKAFEDWKNKAHHIYDYDLKTGQRRTLTEGDHFDFMPISISKEEMVFARYQGNGYYSLIKLANGKEEILAECILFDYEYGEGFYGHFETEKGMDLYLKRME